MMFHKYLHNMFEKIFRTKLNTFVYEIFCAKSIWRYVHVYFLKTVVTSVYKHNNIKKMRTIFL